MPGVMKAAAELSMTGGHVWFPCKFASIANDSWVCICSRLAQSSMQAMMGRSGPGVIAVVGATTNLCLCRAVVLLMRACGRATAHVLRGWPPSRCVEETPPVWAEKELLQLDVVPRALMLANLALAGRSPCKAWPLRLPVLMCTVVLENNGMAGDGHAHSGQVSGFPLVVAPMGGRWGRGPGRRDVILV